MCSGAIEPQFYAELPKLLSQHAPQYSSQAPDRKTQHDRSKWPAVREYLTVCFASKTREEWTNVFVGTDACCVPILTLSEAAVQGVEPRVPAENVGPGDIVVPQPAPRLTRTPAKAPGGSATFAPADQDPGAELLLTPGEHTTEVLQSRLQMSDKELAELWKCRAVGGPDPPEIKSKL